MNTHCRFVRAALLLVMALIGLNGTHLAAAAEGPLLEQDSRAALKSLFDGSPGAKTLGDKAKGILVFPNVVKAGFILGGQGGDGVLLVKEGGRLLQHDCRFCRAASRCAVVRIAGSGIALDAGVTAKS